MFHSFKVGDWCFCEFILQQIKEIEEERITSVTDGNCCLSSFNLNDRCFPLDIKIKRASDAVHYWSKEFHSLKNNALNYPDLKIELIRIWVDLCKNKDNEDELRKGFKNLEDFGRSIVNRVLELQGESVLGVKLFRQITT